MIFKHLQRAIFHISVGHEITSLWFVVSETHKTIQAVATTLGCSLELEGKTLLLNTSPILVIGYGEMKLKEIWKLLPC